MPPCLVVMPRCNAVCGVYGLMFALHAKKRRLQGKDGQACQLLGVIKLECSSILALSKASAVMDAFPTLYFHMEDRLHSSAVMHCLCNSLLSVQRPYQQRATS